jgi:hypothetical protein
MSANINLSISAKNKKNGITSRYEAGGYSYDTNLTLTNHIVTQNIDDQHINFKRIAPNDIKKDILISRDLNTTFQLKANEFKRGKFTDDIKINFTRIANKPLEPIDLFVDKIFLKETNGIKNFLIKGENKTQSNVKFYYARVHAPSPQEVAGKELDAKIYYEIYCKRCNKDYFDLAKNRASIDDVYWYILPKNVFSTLLKDPIHNYKFDSFAKNDNIDFNDYRQAPLKEAYEIYYIRVKKAPDKNRVFYTPLPLHPYLLFDKYNQNVKKHHFDIGFSSASAQWAGEGELGNTIDLDISKIPNQTIDW